MAEIRRTPRMTLKSRARIRGGNPGCLRKSFPWEKRGGLECQSRFIKERERKVPTPTNSLRGRKRIKIA